MGKRKMGDIHTGFNTQPPEGGWALPLQANAKPSSFNTQPPEGGWLTVSDDNGLVNPVSTHSRLKAAGFARPLAGDGVFCFNTQPPEGGWLIPLPDSVDGRLFQHTAA